MRSLIWYAVRHRVTILMVAAAVAAGMLIFLLAGLRPGRRGGDPARRLYERWCRRLARRGLTRGSGEGPLDFAERVARLAPERAGEAAEVTVLYVRARYGNDAGALARLRRRLRRR